MSTKMSKAELAELLGSDYRTFHGASYYASRYTVAELVVLVDAYGYADLYSREARDLFDKVSWSRSLRTNKRLRTRSQGLTGSPAAILL